MLKPFSYGKITMLLWTALVTIQANRALGQNDPARISGIVRAAENKLPAPGATVMLLHTGISTQTGEDGSFALQLKGAADTLLITHVGFSPYRISVAPGAARDISVVLHAPTAELEEVTVSTGLQKIPRERVTGSFSFVNNNQLNQQVGRDVLSRLKGQAPGVLFDDSKAKGANKRLNFTVRGLSTINSNQDPLVILDNFPYEGDLSNINPNDIESISILKDAAAASIWGSRAGNGVIVITSKKGKLNQPMTINFNTNLILTQRPNLYTLPSIPSAEYIGIERLLFDNGYYEYDLTNPFRTAVSPAVEIFASQQSGAITEEQATAALNRLSTFDTRESFSRFYSNGLNQQYSLSAAGGSQRNIYYLSAGYDRSAGVLNDKLQRITVKADNQLRPTKNLQVGLTVTYTNNATKSGHPDYDGFNAGGGRPPYLRFAGDAGEPLAVPKWLRQGYADTAGAGLLLDWNYYPLTDDQHSVTTNTREELLGSILLQYELFKGLQLETRYSYQQQSLNGQVFHDPDSYEARFMINKFSQPDPSVGTVRYLVPTGGILNRSVEKITAQNGRAQLNFQHEWGSHALSSLAGFEVRQIISDTRTTTTYGFDETLFVGGLVDHTNAYPAYFSGFPEFIPSGMSFGQTNNRFVSTFANAAYTYKSRYTATASIRRDASNLFGVRTNDKWNPFWSAGLGWNISRQPFYRSKLIPYLKLRATYGFSGMVDQTQSAVTVINFGLRSFVTGFPTAGVTRYANPDLRWESVRTVNVGIDFATKANRLSGSIEFYQKKGTDLFGYAPVDYTAGVNDAALTRNVASMAAKGMDITVNSANLSGAFSWNTSILLSLYTDKTLSYYHTPAYVYPPQRGVTISPIEGKALHAIAAYRWAGLDDNGDPLGFVNKEISKDYQLITRSTTSIDSLRYFGSASPRVFGNINNSLSWKKFTISINIGYKFGYYFFRPVTDYANFFSLGRVNSDFAQRWRQPGDELKTSVPSFYYPADPARNGFYSGLEANVQRADHARLEYINLEYAFSGREFRSSIMKGLKLYANLGNAGIIWRANDIGLDPEYPDALAPARTYAFGLRTSF